MYSIKKAVALFATAAAVIGSCQTAVNGPDAPIDGTAADFVRNMGIGVNIGNTLDSINNHVSNTPAGETGWGNPRITRDFIQALKDYGYTAIRLPVTWAEYLGPAPDFAIDAARMDRVEEVVNWILEEDLYCILNLHHDGGGSPKSWILNAGADPDGTIKQFTAVWSQIAKRFSGASDKLVLEAMNEIGFDNLWNRWGPSNPEGKAKAFDTLNRLNQAFVDTVRKTGGKNTSRFLLVSGYWTDIELTCDPLFKMPTDKVKDRLILSVHYYTPATFCILSEDASWGQNRTDWGNDADYAELNKLFAMLKNNFPDKDIPVILGEYGVNFNGKVEAARTRWIAAVTQACLDAGICPAFWDTGNDIKRSPATAYEMSEALKAALKQVKKGDK